MKLRAIISDIQWDNFDIGDIVRSVLSGHHFEIIAMEINNSICWLKVRKAQNWGSYYEKWATAEMFSREG